MGDSIYYWDEEIDEILSTEFGVPREELDKDIIIQPKNSFGGKDYAISEIGGEKVCDALHESIMIEGVEYINIAKCLDSMEETKFYGLWSNNYAMRIIAQLFRFPGGYHEWLTIANIFHLKAMGIPLSWVAQFRTPTASCKFYVNGTECYHGGEHSTEMHNCLYKTIEEAYRIYVTSKDGKESPISFAYAALRTQFRLFLDKYYGQNEYPEAIKEFLSLGK